MITATLVVDAECVATQLRVVNAGGRCGSPRVKLRLSGRETPGVAFQVVVRGRSGGETSVPPQPASWSTTGHLERTLEGRAQGRFMKGERARVYQADGCVSSAC